jgi:hypothetical protein
MCRLIPLAFALVLGVVIIACGSGNGGTPTATSPSTSATGCAARVLSTPGATVAPPTNGPPPTVQAQPTVTSSGLQIIDVRMGTGPSAKVSDCLTLRYTGWLQDGTIFGSSALSGGAISTGLVTVLPGLQEGIPGMKVGGVRRLIIPPELAFGLYGSSNGSVPPNATLTFDIELVSIP